jgi:hypothetical protein
MSKQIWLAAAVTIATALSGCQGPSPKNDRVEGVEKSAPCIDASSEKNQISLSGKLTSQIFAGPPNFESIAGGDSEIKAFILQLPETICVFDGGFFAEPSERIATVHVSSSDEVILKVLTESIGRNVKISGKAFAAHTAHHRAPLVLMAESVTVSSAP